MKDGREVLIGNRCGRKHFNASDDFIRQSRAIDTKLKLERLRGQLELILENKPRIAEKIEDALQRTRVMEERTSKIKRSLPPAITRAVNVRRAQGDPSVTLDVSYEEKDEKGRKKTMWRSQRLGSLKGLAFWGMSIREMRLRLQKISESLEDACPAGTDDFSTLSQWVEDLSSVDRLLRDLDQYERALERFTDPENLRLVMFLVKSHLDQEAVAQLLLGFAEPEVSPDISPGPLSAIFLA